MNIQSIRKHKIFGLSIFDIVTSFAIMIIVFTMAWKTHFQKLKLKNFIIAALILSIPVAITIHIIFGINTKLNYKLGLSYRL
jgi:NhaP-type Na+/H+ or K+/H+ antiporter